MTFVSSVIVAGGMGKRMKSSVPKQFLPVHGQPVLFYTLKLFDSVPEIDEIVVVLPKSEIDHFYTQISDKLKPDKKIKITEGGVERQDSVRNGLDKVNESSSIVLIHDGVRPFVKKDRISDLIKCCRDGCYGAVLCQPVFETIKYADENGFIKKTVPRDNIYLAQTPQAFKTKIIKSLHLKALNQGLNATDDSQLLEHFGFDVKVVQGNRENIKITVPEDLEFAAKFFAE
ncbi:MAG: 2-C-methyl-D-erythritol 4-phosphate cytidylyltransferase [Thermodesulfobacteriota bacterium]